MMMKKRTRKLSSSSSSSLVVVIFGLFLFLSSSLYTTVAVAEKDPTTTTSTSSQLRSNSKCIDRGYDPNVVRCDYCRFALKDALGENDNQNQFVSECLECCNENEDDENDAFNGVKFDRATITACS
jgi:cytoskeletal protein RodZ